MAFKDLQEFIAELDRRGWLKRIKTEVDADLEISEITDRVCKMPGGGPALLFEKVKGYDMPVATNLVGSYERLNLALGVSDLDDIGKEIMSFLQPPEGASLDGGLFGKLKTGLKTGGKLLEIGNFMPKTVKTGPVKEVIHKDNPSLDILPILKTWPMDGGPFITLPLVFTKDPETGRRNVGMYRMQKFDSQTTGMHWHMHKHGAHHMSKNKKLDKRMEVAVALGCDPAVIYSATAPLPPDIDEMLLAGFLRKEPMEMVKGETVDIEVPANAEIIIEGYVDPEERRWEGPFGDHTGYYSLADDYPVFHVTCITHRKKPVYPATVVGKPPMEDCYLGKATERIFLPILKLVVPEIVDMNLPWEGVFHNCAVISIKKSFPKHAHKVMQSIWGMGQMAFTKNIIIVDHWVDVQDMSQVWWRVFNNTDAKRDMAIVEGPLDALDHSSPMPLWGSKLGIDATKKWPSEGHTREWPDEIEMSQDIRDLVERKWAEYGVE